MIEINVTVFTILVVLATAAVFETVIGIMAYEKYLEWKKLEKDKDIMRKSPDEPTIVYENGRKRYLYKPRNMRGTNWKKKGDNKKKSNKKTA